MDVKAYTEQHPSLVGVVGKRRASAAQSLRVMVIAITGLGAFACLIVAVLTAAGRLPWNTIFATDWFLGALLLGGGPFGFFALRDLRRIDAINDKFPDFLRDIAESARAGMTLPRALVTAAHGTYGALTDDIRIMSAQVEWGVAFDDALQRFAQRADTPLIDRTVSLIVEAQRAGGNVVDVLTAASDDAREIKQIVDERNQQMQSYQLVIFVAYFVFIAVVMVLVTQFIPSFKEAVDATGGGGAQVGGISFKDFDPQQMNNLFFQAAIIQAIGGGLVGGVLTRGNPIAGIPSVAVMIGISWLIFRTVGL